ncbi:hypothetical protein EB118_08110 [bacterium]|nr:hypothetical protein [bacterium]
MDSQELRSLSETYMEVYQLDEGYKPPKGKMTKRVAHKWLKGVNTLTTAHGAGEDLDPKGGTAGGQIAVQKSEKLGRQAQKIYQTAQRHNPEASKEKERQNRAVGDTARKEGPISAAALRDRFKKTGTNTPKKKNNYGKAVRDGIISGINDALGEEYDIYDIILSHLLDEGYAETPEAAEAIMVNMSEDWRESICENVTSGKSRVRNIQPKPPTGPISNREIEASNKSRIDAEKSRIKKAGDEAHAAAISKGLSFSEAQSRKKAAELRLNREIEKSYR